MFKFDYFGKYFQNSHKFFLDTNSVFFSKNIGYNHGNTTRGPLRVPGNTCSTSWWAAKGSVYSHSSCKKCIQLYGQEEIQHYCNKCIRTYKNADGEGTLFSGLFSTVESTALDDG